MVHGSIIIWTPLTLVAGNKALYVGNKMMNVFRKEDRKTWEQAREVAKEIIHAENAPQGVHQLTAIGHCHIDTAWLWPYGETKRKLARSWAAQIRLMEEYPEHKFACSQMQQFDWCRELYPGLFEEIKKFTQLGKFIPIGGTWVEMDCNSELLPAIPFLCCSLTNGILFQSPREKPSCVSSFSANVSCANTLG